MSPTTTSRMAVGLLGLLLAACGLTGCGAGQPAGPAAATTAGTVDAERCPVTLPRDVGPPGVSPRDFFGWASSYGNGRLWVGGCGRAASSTPDRSTSPRTAPSA